MSETATELQPRPHPIAEGLAAARANLVPGLALQALALAIVLAYYFVPAVREALTRLAEFKLESGLAFAIVSTATFGGAIPVMIEQFRPADRRYAHLRHLGFFVIFWGIKGIEVELLYRGQAWLFGDAATLAAVLPKMLVDQLIYVPLWAVPTTVLGYLWKDSGFSLRRARQRLGPHWYRDRIVPLMLSNWAVWIPTVAIIYCLPLPLQLPLQNLVLCLWALMVIFITRR